MEITSALVAEVVSACKSYLYRRNTSKATETFFWVDNSKKTAKCLYERKSNVRADDSINQIQDLYRDFILAGQEDDVIKTKLESSDFHKLILEVAESIKNRSISRCVLPIFCNLFTKFPSDRAFDMLKVEVITFSKGRLPQRYSGDQIEFTSIN